MWSGEDAERKRRRRQRPEMEVSGEGRYSGDRNPVVREMWGGRGRRKKRGEGGREE